MIRYLLHYHLTLLGLSSWKQYFVPKRLKSEREATKYKNIWLLGMGFVLKTNCKKKPFIVFHFWEFQKQQQEDIAVSPLYWARAAASKVVEQQASSKISNFPFWFSQNQKTNSILRKGFEIENWTAVLSSQNGHNKGPYKPSSDSKVFDKQGPYIFLLLCNGFYFPVMQTFSASKRFRVSFTCSNSTVGT